MFLLVGILGFIPGITTNYDWLHLLLAIGMIALGVALGRSLPGHRTTAAGTD